MKIINLNINNLIKEYNAGKSVKALAEQFGVSRSVIIRNLNKCGITPRNRSEAMYLRMSRTSLEERQALSAAAHEAVRGRNQTEESLHKIALARQKRIGKFEHEFIQALNNAGIPTNPQEPFLRYNLDIGCGDIAIEIHCQISSPLSKNYIKRLVECVHAGKNMIYVWISPRYRNGIVTDECYKQVVSTVQNIRLNPPSTCQYWVIRGTGETYSVGSFDFD